ncbi:glycoside hydrolase family 18 protein [Sphingobacterium sp. MYb382]|uniref:glycoside hydrolase family 18 protein n=1 Tax=Sphingobacterium sp. MYb382 TaxID=2745278 RepID=UPI0030A59349
MNLYKKLTYPFLLLAVLMIGFKSTAAFAKKPSKVIIAYVTSWTSVMPDPTHITHINYAFGHVTNTFDGVRIDNEARLKSIVALKKKHPHLKVMLSIGGWGSGRFSEMAADATNRAKFAKDCMRVVKEFGLDGIDIDWEYPTSSAAGISNSPADTDNFTLLMRDIRQAIGKKNLLTLATASNGKYIAFGDINPYVDFVNIMTYDSGNPPYHHASLFRSDKSGNVTCEEAVAAHVKAGMPIEKLVLGIPFYGRGNKKEVKTFIDYKDLLKLEGLETKWDDVAKADYMVNSDGELVLTFETPESIKYKCEYLLSKGMLGAMYWEYAGDTAEGTLRKAVYEGVNKK